jgi:hypothetical protein
VLRTRDRTRPVVAQVVRVRAVEHRGEAQRAGDGSNARPQLRLAVVAAVGRIRRVARVAHLVRVDLSHRYPELLGDAPGRLPLLGGIRRAAADDGEYPVAAQRLERDAGEVRRVDAAAKADDGRAAVGEPGHEAPLLVGRDLRGRGDWLSAWRVSHRLKRTPARQPVGVGGKSTELRLRRLVRRRLRRAGDTGAPRRRPPSRSCFDRPDRRSSARP